MRDFCVADTNMLVSKNPRAPNKKPCTLNMNPDVGHVRFMLFVSILFALGTQRELTFLWNMFQKFQQLLLNSVCQVLPLCLSQILDNL